ncbi:hypothetical protein Ae201684P_007971 [Aphanomyces euteiches]|nr:hypothetical protein Ae201684P_007971 [Aphanomyces euteiches]
MIAQVDRDGFLQNAVVLVVVVDFSPRVEMLFDLDAPYDFALVFPEERLDGVQCGGRGAVVWGEEDIAKEDGDKHAEERVDDHIVGSERVDQSKLHCLGVHAIHRCLANLEMEGNVVDGFGPSLVSQGRTFIVSIAM